MLRTIAFSDFGMNVPKSVEILQVLVAPGVPIVEDEPFMDVSAEKSTFELPSIYSGTVAEVLVKVGDHVSIDQPLIVVNTSDEENDTLNIRTGIRYLTDLSPDYLCNREELGEFDFQSLRPYFRRIYYTSRYFRYVDLKLLSQETLTELRFSLYDATSLVAHLMRFASDLRKAREGGIVGWLPERHRHVVEIVGQRASHRVERFYQALRLCLQEGGGGIKIGETVASILPRSEAFIFISYSHVDLDVAKRIAARAADLGLEVFLDEDPKRIDWGASIPSEIHRALDIATHILVVVSPAAVRSAWVAYEVGFAAGKGVPIVPRLLHASQEVPDFLKDRRHVRSDEEEVLFLRSLQEYRRPSYEEH